MKDWSAGGGEVRPRAIVTVATAGTDAQVAAHRGQTRTPASLRAIVFAVSGSFMSLASVRAFFAERSPDIAVVELDTRTATVAEAAVAHGVDPAQIAKTLSLRVGDQVVLVVTRGDVRLDNRKAKAVLGGKVRMLDLDAVEAITGHPVGGVCPFGLAAPLRIYCDVSLKAFDAVVPAAGSACSAVRIAPERMAALTGATWVDVCQAPG